MNFEIFTTSAGLTSLFTLTLLEIILGVDNIIFISIIADKLPKNKQLFARNMGLFIAMLVRIVLLIFIGYILGMTKPLFTILDIEFTGKSLILLGGGVFLIYKSTVEMHNKVKGVVDETGGKGKQVLSAVIMQIVLIDIVFSFDSILTAVGVAKDVEVMIGAVILSMGVMFLMATKIATFINARPTIKMLALSFLVTIGVVLVMEGLGQHIQKGPIYFAMVFSLLVETLNIRMRKNKGKTEH
jgi:predicted tellurium resistance membrane protein TerC